MKAGPAFSLGTRVSTYENRSYKDAAPFAGFVMDAITSADPTDPTLEPVPYVGVQMVTIPEFQSIGTQVGQMIAAALAGQMSVEQALSSPSVPPSAPCASRAIDLISTAVISTAVISTAVISKAVISKDLVDLT